MIRFSCRPASYQSFRVALLDGMRISPIANNLIRRRLEKYWARTSDEIKREELWGVPIRFGQFETELNLTNMDDFKRVYGYGACMILIEPLAKRTKGKLRVWSYTTSSKGWQGHVAIHVDANHVIDSYGLVTAEEAYARYPQFETRTITEEILTLKEFRKRAGMNFYTRTWWKIFGRIENELAETFAKLIIEGLSSTVDKVATMEAITIPPVRTKRDIQQALTGFSQGPRTRR